MEATQADQIAERVRDFYESLPFNFHDSEEASARGVERNPVRAYPDLHELLQSGAISTALDMGCGTGWLANALALHYRVATQGVDLCARAVARAEAVSRRLGVEDRARFSRANLFAFEPGGLVDLVASVGALHHTHDCGAAVRRVARFVRPGGHLFLGLYHAHGRRVFLDHLKGFVERDGEEAAFRRYKRLRGGGWSRAVNRTHQRSWFRDQVLHPHETQHTLTEVTDWLASSGLSLESTSLNEWGPVDEREALLRAEGRYAELSRRANVIEGRFFPGFFTVLARRI